MRDVCSLCGVESEVAPGQEDQGLGFAHLICLAKAGPRTEAPHLKPDGSMFSLPRRKAAWESTSQHGTSIRTRLHTDVFETYSIPSS